MEQLRGGAGLGQVWKFLVFASGFLLPIVALMGFMTWFKKRQKGPLWHGRFPGGISEPQAIPAERRRMRSIGGSCREVPLPVHRRWGGLHSVRPR